MRRKNIRVVHKKLEKDEVWGWADVEKWTIEIDKTITGKKHLEIAIHEGLHLLFPDSEEDAIVEQAIQLTNLLWKLKYRRVDVSNKIPLQDGEK